jgi:carbamoyltransferase
LLVLGISGFYHDSAACLLRDGALIAAVEEERLSRVKHDHRMPWKAARYCLERAKATICDIDVVAFYEEPIKKLSRRIWIARHSGITPKLREDALKHLDPRYVARQLSAHLGYEGPIEFFSHHESHAASSFFYSGFEDAALLTADGVGEWATTTYGAGKAHTIDLFEEVEFPHSLGLLYSTITAYLGFEVNEGEYKVMGLAPYGSPRFTEKIRRLIEVERAGQYRLNLEYFDFLSSAERMFSPKLAELFEREPRAPGSDLEMFHKDVARSLQAVLEDVLLEKVHYLHKRVGSANLCLAGGVALNCVANGRLLREGPFSRLFVQPAAGDSGGALGAAALAYARRTGKRLSEPLAHVYLGPSFASADIAALLDATDLQYLDFRGQLDDLLNAIADRLAAGKIVGFFHGSAEFGPRALGARSILADPRGEDMRDRINAMVKMREAFRPFAPAVLEEKAAAHFDIDHASPFMLETCQVRSPLQLPAITHADGSARLQTVNHRQNPRFAALLACFEKKTGCPILLNTSFNVKGEPIVCTPEDALLCFARSKIDVLVLEDFVIDRATLPLHWEQAAERIPVAPPLHGVSHAVYAML